MDITPIFIGGAERSGTTLLGSLLGSLPDSVVTPESQFKTDLLRLAHEPGSWPRILEKNFRFKLWELNIHNLTAETPQQFIAGIVQRYARQHGAGEARYWIDHTPNNMQYASALQRAFPHAWFIHIVRDGRAVYNSMKHLDWGTKNAFDGAILWTRKLSYGLAAELAAPGNVVRIRYEDLVGDTASVELRLKEFLRIDNLELASESSRTDFLPGYTRKQHSLVSDRLQADRIDSWRNSLNSREIEIFESISAGILEHLGYGTLFGIAARPLTRGEKRKLQLSTFLTYRMSRIRRMLRRHTS